MKIFLPTSMELPDGFKYPIAYLRYLEAQDLNQFYPWRFLAETPEEMSFMIQIMNQEYPGKNLIPFARFEDSANGDLACFYGNDHSGNPIIYFHVFCRQGTPVTWEDRYFLKDFDAWLEMAKEEAWDEEDRP